MPRTIVRNVKDPAVAVAGEYTSLSAWAAQEARNLTKMRGFLFDVSPTTLVNDNTTIYTFSGGWQGKFRGIDGAGTLGRFEEVTATALPAAGETVSDGTNTYTVSSVDYSDGEIAVADCYAMTDSTAVDMTGLFTTNSSCYVRVQGATGSEAKSYWRASGAYLLANTSGTYALTGLPAYTRVVGIQVSPYNYGLLAGDYCTFDRLFIRRTSGAGGTGIRMWQNNQQTVTNTIIDGMDMGIDASAYISGSSYRAIYNITINNCNRGIYWGTRNPYVKIRNVVSYGCTTCFDGTGDATSQSYNASTDTTAPGANASASISLPAWVDRANGDFRLRHTDTVLRGKGTDLTSEGVTGDIEGHSRVQWDIGATESPTLISYTLRENGTGDFTTLQNLHNGISSADRNLRGLNRAIRVTIDQAWTNPDPGIKFAADWSMDVTRRLEIVATGPARHTGKWTPAAYRIVSTTNYTSPVDLITSTVAAVGLYLDGIQVSMEPPTNAGLGCVASTNATTECSIASVGCIFRHVVASTAVNYVAYRINAPGPGYISLENCLSISKAGNTNRHCYINNAASGGNIRLLNNTFVGAAGVVHATGGANFRAENNIEQQDSSGTLSALWVTMYCTGTKKVGHNLTNGTAATGALAGTGDIYNTTVAFADAPNGVYSLAASDTSGAKDGGGTLSDFTTDIAGTARPQGSAWDIGAFEYIVQAVTSRLKVFLAGSFTVKPLKVWDGSAWVLKPLKQWDGTSWITRT